MSTYNHLLDRLFENNNEEIFIGFDCKLLRFFIYVKIKIINFYFVQVNGNHYIIIHQNLNKI